MSQALESRVNKMRETYFSGLSDLKELANMLRNKASSDLERINAAISSQAITVENVCRCCCFALVLLVLFQNLLVIMQCSLAVSCHNGYGC